MIASWISDLIDVGYLLVALVILVGIPIAGIWSVIEWWRNRQKRSE
jgi:hypothetical protein